MTVDKMSLDKNSRQNVSCWNDNENAIDKMTADKMYLNRIVVKLSIDKLTVDEMSIDKLTADGESRGKLTRQHVCR